MGEIVGLAAAARSSRCGLGHVARRILELRGTRLVACPETGHFVAVDLDLQYSAVHSALGRPHFRLKDCSRWPERAGCGQTCLGDLEAAPHACLVRTILARWYAGQRCACCRRPFGEIHWHDHKPALARTDGITREWTRDPAGDHPRRALDPPSGVLELPRRGDVPPRPRGAGGGPAAAPRVTSFVIGDRGPAG